VRLLVLGGTGRLGQLAVREALQRGHSITLLVRSPDKLGELAGRVRVVTGDALDERAVGRAVSDQDAVIYALGAPHVRHTSLFSESTRVLLEQMTRHAVRRLVCVTGVGAGETKGHGGFLYDRIVYPLFTRGIYADKDRQESLIRRSDSDWTIVRPASFRSRTPRGPLRAETSINGVVLRRVSLDEVASLQGEE
jgi:putative NADH-flavin reductase